MKHEGRGKRVAEEIRKKIADLLLKGIKDPRIGFVSVMEVKMSPDLRYATVYVSLFGSEKERKSSLIGLQQAAGWIRHEIARNLRLRHVPEIRFEPDTTLDKAFRLEEVFKEIRAEREKEQQTTPREPSDST